MLEVRKILFQIENNIDVVLSEETPLGSDLYRILTEQHPADIAMLIARIGSDYQVPMLTKLPQTLALNVFRKLPENVQAGLLVQFDTDYATTMLNGMHVDELTDIFDNLSDEDLEKYLKLLQKKQRSQIISMLNFGHDSAGGRMNSDVVTLQKDFTIKKSIELLQRLSPEKELLRRIYVTNRDNVLVGHITLDTLVFNKPEMPLSKVLEKNEIHIYADEDQEDVARQILHYDISAAPVVDRQNHFLGVITSKDVIAIIKEEESEDVYKRFGLSTVEYSYFATPAWKLITQRGIWLVGLLLFQSVSSLVLGHYDEMIKQYAVLTVFLGMLIGTGGNAGNQSATLVIRGLTTKEISRRNVFKVLLREFWISIVIASMLFVVGFGRMYFSHYYEFSAALAVNLSLFCIVILSMLTGSIIPILLEFFNVDPAHSAAPFLTTFMDILGVIIYCAIFGSIMG
ncbi:magnesium transporter [Candidatus Babeliales bacterium]|nr:magnesium transporter [Candidatus Babeliales bacterium]